MPKRNLRGLPAYQEYASDMLADMEYRTMSVGERGLFYSMRLQCWVNKFIPENAKDLARVLSLNLEEVEANLAFKVLKYFKGNDDGMLFCPELEAYRQNQMIEREAKSQGGRRGGEMTQSRNRSGKGKLEGELDDELE